MREHDAGSAEVEQLIDEATVDLRNADESCNSRSVGGANEVRRARQIERAVLHVEDDEVETRGSANLDDHRAAREDEHTLDDIARSEPLAYAVLHQLHAGRTE